MEVEDIPDTLSSFTLFGDLSRPALEAMAHAFEEEWFGEGQRIIREGFTGTGFYVILDGQASVQIDGAERAKLGRGDFFGELSILLDEPPSADIVALGPLRCLVLPRSQLTPLSVPTNPGLRGVPLRTRLGSVPARHVVRDAHCALASTRRLSPRSPPPRMCAEPSPCPT